MLRVGVLVSGGGSNLQAIIDQVEQGSLNAEIVAVVSNLPEAYALERAKKHNIPDIVIRRKSFADQDAYEDAIIDVFRKHKAELIVLAGFVVVLGHRFISAFRNAIMNVHPSLIPSFCGKGYYGIHVHEAVISKGVKITGATVHFVDEGTDTGPIILQKAVKVCENDTPEKLQKRVMEEAEWILLPQAIALFAEGKLKIEDNRVKKVGEII